MTSGLTDFTRLEGMGAMTAEATLGRIREYMVGPTRFMNLLSCFELGIVDTLRDNPGVTATDSAPPSASSPTPSNNCCSCSSRKASSPTTRPPAATPSTHSRTCPSADLNARARPHELDQGHHAPAAVLPVRERADRHARRPEGALRLRREPCTRPRPSTRTCGRPWSKVMDATTERIDPWFFANIDVPAGARVLDLAGNTGLGAIHTYKMKASPGLRVTTFDLPEKRGGVPPELPRPRCGGALLVHRRRRLRHDPQGLRRRADQALPRHVGQGRRPHDPPRRQPGAGGGRPGPHPGAGVPGEHQGLRQLHHRLLPELLPRRTMGQGGPQKLSVYQSWLEECGFTVTKAISREPAELPRYALPVQGILCATKNA